FWSLDSGVAGTGALGDLGSHISDLGRFLVGEPTRTQAITKTFIEERPLPGGGRGKVDVDDAFIALLEFENGAIGSVEASRFCAGRKNFNNIEINYDKEPIHFNLNRPNALTVDGAAQHPK